MAKDTLTLPPLYLLSLSLESEVSLFLSWETVHTKTGDWAKEQITEPRASSLFTICGGKAFFFFLSDYKEFGRRKLDRRRTGDEEEKKK